MDIMDEWLLWLNTGVLDDGMVLADARRALLEDAGI